MTLTALDWAREGLVADLLEGKKPCRVSGNFRVLLADTHLHVQHELQLSSEWRLEQEKLSGESVGEGFDSLDTRWFYTIRQSRHKLQYSPDLGGI